MPSSNTNNSVYSEAAERAPLAKDREFVQDAWLTFPELKTLWSNRRPDDKVVGFKERIGESTQFTGPIDPGPQRHRLLL